MQDEPEREPGFSRKMSLKGKIEMLDVDHQLTNHEYGTDQGISVRQRRSSVCRARPGGGVRLGGADTGTAPVRQPEPSGQGISAALHRPHYRPEPGVGDAPDYPIPPE